MKSRTPNAGDSSGRRRAAIGALAATAALVFSTNRLLAMRCPGAGSGRGRWDGCWRWRSACRSFWACGDWARDRTAAGRPHWLGRPRSCAAGRCSSPAGFRAAYAMAGPIRLRDPADSSAALLRRDPRALEARQELAAWTSPGASSSGCSPVPRIGFAARRRMATPPSYPPTRHAGRHGAAPSGDRPRPWQFRGAALHRRPRRVWGHWWNGIGG